MDNELIKQAKECKNAEELIALAKEKGFEMSEAEAQNYFAMLNKKSGELADNELASVSGGCTTYDENHDYHVETFMANGCRLFVEDDPNAKVYRVLCCYCKHYQPYWELSVNGICLARKKGADPIND